MMYPLLAVDMQMATWIGCGVLTAVALIPTSLLIHDRIKGPKAGPPQQVVVSPEPLIIKFKDEFATIAMVEKVEGNLRSDLESRDKKQAARMDKFEDDVRGSNHRLGESVHANLLAAQNHREIVQKELGEIKSAVSEIKGSNKVNDQLATELRGQLASILQRLPRDGQGGRNG